MLLTKTANQRMWVLYINRAMAVLALLSLISCRQVSKQPVLSFEEEAVEIGTLYKDSPIADFDIQFTNEGGQRLNVYKIVTSCTCTEILSLDSLTDTGDEGHIRGRLDMTDYPPGRFAKELIIFSNGSDEPLHYHLVGELKYKNRK